MSTRRPDLFEVGDAVQWKDTDVEVPVLRTGRVIAVLSEMYLILDPLGATRFVFKRDASLCTYKESE